MNKTHITLVGGQLIPVYQGIVEFDSDLVVLVHTKETLQQAKHIQSIVSSEVQLLEVDAVDLSKIQNKVKPYFEDEKSEISVNITSGTKIMSLVLFQLASMHKTAHAFYIDQNGKIYDFKQDTKRDLRKKLKTIELFKITGYPLKSFRTYDAIHPNEFTYIKEVKKLKNANIPVFFNLLKQYLRRPDLTEFDNERGSYIKYYPKEDRIDMCIKKRNNSYFLDYSFQLPNVISYILNTGWFEIEMAQVFRKWKHTQDIIIQAKVPYETGSDKNEIDIIVNTGNKLLFVECKLHVHDIKDIDKFRNVVKNYGGLGAKSILITQQEIKRNVAEKCQDNGIIYFNFKEQTENSLMRVEDALFLLLEEELSTINPK